MWCFDSDVSLLMIIDLIIDRAQEEPRDKEEKKSREMLMKSRARR